jgi:hypothetical protein
MKTSLTVLGLIALLAGCATPPRGAALVDDPGDLPSLQDKLAASLSQLKIGMPLEEFRKLFPEAYVGGQSGPTTAYEIAQSQKYVTQADIDRQNVLWGVGSPRAKSRREVLWFYFYKEQLVQWGRPQDWPKDPDLILEQRIR